MSGGLFDDPTPTPVVPVALPAGVLSLEHLTQLRQTERTFRAWGADSIAWTGIPLCLAIADALAVQVKQHTAAHKKRKSKTKLGA